MKILLSPDALASAAPATSATPSAPTPAAPSTPAPATPEKPDLESELKSSDPFGELAKKPESKEEKKPEAKPGEEKKKDALEQQPDKKLAKKEPGESSVIRDLRKRGDDAIKERDEYKSKWEAHQKNGEQNGGALTKTIEQKDATIKELQTKLAKYDYRNHPEFVDKFQKPLDTAAKRARTIVESLSVIEPGKDGAEATSRRASWADFQRLTGMDRHMAKQAAKVMFGEDAGDVMAQYDTLRDLYDRSQEAANDYASKADEMLAAERSQEIQKAEKATQAFKAATDALMKEHPDQFGESKDNPEHNEVFKKALDIVDGAYFRREKMSPEELVVLDASIRLRAARSVILEREVASLRTELQELRAEKEGQEESASGKTTRRAEPAKSGESDLEKAAREAFA